MFRSSTGATSPPGISANLRTVAILETDTVSFRCPRSTSQLRLFVTHVNGHVEWFADFTRDNCATFRHMKCSQDEDTNILTVPVSNETRTIVSYSCGESLNYTVKFYAGPDHIQCGIPELNNLGETITVSCGTSRIYPHAECLFTFTFKQSTSIVEGQVGYSLLESFGSPVYYRDRCTLTVNVSKLPVGDHQFQVKVQPVGLNITAIPYNVTPSILLYPIKTRLNELCLKGRNVVKGFIKVGTKARCLCMKEKDSKIFGTVYWSNGNDIIVSDNSSALLTVSFPEVGPDKLFLSKSSIRLELCTNTTLTCSASSEAVHPGVSFVWFSDNQDAIFVQSETPSSDRSSTVTLSARLPGKYILTCKGVNTIFPELFAEVDIVVVIEESSRFEPIISINQGQIVKQSAPSEDVNITCYTGAVSDMTFTCFSTTLSQKTSSLSVAHKLTREDNGHLCSCTAKYSCYGNKTVHTPVYLAYGPDKLKVNSAALDIDLCVNRIITVSVPENNAYPGIYFNISVSDPESVIWKLTSSNLSATIEITAQKVGQFKLAIDAFNTFDRDKRIQATVDLSVSSSSLLNPVLIINNRETVKEGISSDNVDITCKSSNSNSSQIILTCLGTNVTTNRTDVTIFKNLTRSQNGEKCYCQVEYHSSCNYTGLSTVPINVTYEAYIVSFTANNHSITEVLEGENVSLVCIVDSNSRPNINLYVEEVSNVVPKHLFTNKTNETSQNIWMLSYEIQNIQCRQSSVYNCVAGNGLFTQNVIQTVTIIVRCPVQLAYPSERDQKVLGVSNGVGAVSFDLIGYPEPVSFSLSRGSSNEPVNSNHYSYIYKKHTFYFGTLIVLIDKLTEENFTFYSVNVSNKEYSELVIKFTLVKGSELLTQTIVIIICVTSFLSLLLLLIAVFVVYKCIRHTRKEDSRNELHCTTERLNKPITSKRKSGYISGLMKRLFQEDLDDELYDEAEYKFELTTSQKRTSVEISPPKRISKQISYQKRISKQISPQETMSDTAGNKNKDESDSVTMRKKKGNKKDGSRETKPLNVVSSEQNKKKNTQNLQDIKEEEDSLRSLAVAGHLEEIEVQDQNLATSFIEEQAENDGDMDLTHYLNGNIQQNGDSNSIETEDSALVNLPSAPDIPQQNPDEENYYETDDDQTFVKTVVPSSIIKKDPRYSAYSINPSPSMNLRISSARSDNFPVLNPSSKSPSMTST
ncbi:hypothetical protein Btru_041133 [Bulinus truncatus]|nr:hypothetical protein Btru_041133 [Bulinus truncatus]